MPEVHPCEILVVGAGPAGSRAAWAAAREGIDTILIDAKTRIGEQPHCGEFVSERLFAEAQLDGAAILHRVEFMETRIVESADPSIWDAGARGVFNVVSSRGFLIDRVRFDRDRAREAAAAGATIFSSTRLVRRDGELWIAQRGSEELILRPKFTIAADGATSAVARLLGLSAHTLLRGVQIEAPFTGQGDRTYVFFHQALKEGYGWVFPKGQVANVGIGVASGPEIKPTELLERFVTGVARLGLIRPGRLARWGGPISVSGLREELVVGDVLFCGDAAGLTHPITGAGIAPAVFSGELAGRAAAEALQTGRREPLEAYDHEVRGRFSGVLGHALSKRRFLSENWDSPDFRSVCQRTWISFREYRKRERTTV